MKNILLSGYMAPNTDIAHILDSCPKNLDTAFRPKIGFYELTNRDQNNPYVITISNLNVEQPINTTLSVTAKDEQTANYIAQKIEKRLGFEKNSLLDSIPNLINPGAMVRADEIILTKGQ